MAEDVRPLGIDQSNTSVVLGGRTVLKCYRRVAPGGHPEIELTRWLSGRGLACLPAVHGSATVSLGGGEPAGALLLQDFVADGRDGWLAAEAELGAFLDAGDPEAAASAPEAWAPGVGRATAELHALLATAEEPAFAPRRATAADAEQLAAGAAAELDEALARVGGEAGAELAAAVPALRARFALFAEAEPPLLTRVHGDLHLGQFLLRAGGEPMLVDFEGEPTKSAAERRRLASPLRDLAGLLRSVDHAAHWVCHARGETAEPVALAWLAAARGAIRSAYEQRLAELGAPFAVDPGLLAAFEAEKAAYEFVYAARFLPSWLEVPRRALPRRSRLNPEGFLADVLAEPAVLRRSPTPTRTGLSLRCPGRDACSSSAWARRGSRRARVRRRYGRSGSTRMQSTPRRDGPSRPRRNALRRGLGRRRFGGDA